MVVGWDGGVVGLLALYEVFFVKVVVVALLVIIDHIILSCGQ